MAVVLVSSTSVSNANATPKVLNTPNVYRGKSRELQDIAAIANGDSIASIYRMFRVRSSDRIASLKLYISANITSGAANIGLYGVNGGAAVSVALLAAATTIATASLTGIDLTFSVTTLANANKRVWELLGLSADPSIEYEVALTLTAAAAAAGTVVLRAAVVAGD